MKKRYTILFSNGRLYGRYFVCLKALNRVLKRYDRVDDKEIVEIIPYAVVAKLVETQRT